MDSPPIKGVSVQEINSYLPARILHVDCIYQMFPKARSSFEFSKYVLRNVGHFARTAVYEMAH